MKRYIFLLLAAGMIFSCTEVQELECGDNITLSTGWKVSRDGDKIKYDATVPSTVAAVLCENDYFSKDVMVGKNYEEIDKSIFDTTWTWATKFKADPKASNYELCFDGISYYADIFLNGKQIAAADTTFGVFIERDYNITELLKRNNTLEVRLRKARKGDLNIGFVDWNPVPVDASMGIVRPVSLHASGDVAIKDVYVKPSLNIVDFSSAELEVMVTLRNFCAEAREGVLCIEIGDGQQCKVPFAVPGACDTELIFTSKDAANLHIDNPRVWWSYDLGEPELYEINVECLIDGVESDEFETEFGVREISSRITEDGHRQFTLNGRDILIKGAGWTDDIFLRDTHKSLKRQVKYVRDMNLNCIRFENIWGKDDKIYELCDKYGILAIVGWSCQWEWEDYCGIPEKGRYGCIYTPELEDLAVRYFHDQVIRLHNHPCVIAWFTGSDGIPNPRLEPRYFDIYERYDYRPYVCSAKALTSLAGPSGTKMAGPYEYVGPDYWYFDRENGGAFGFNTETCSGASIPQKETLEKIISPEGMWPLSDEWDFHCTTSSSAMYSTERIQKAVEGYYGGFSDLDDFLAKAYAVDYNATRAMFESFRVNVPNTTGIVQWMLNSAWPSLYWQVYDWYGVPTAGYYAVKKACEPMQLIFNYKDRKVYAVNSSGRARHFNASVKVYDIDGALISEQNKTLKVEHRQPTAVFDLAGFDGKAHTVALCISKNCGKKIYNSYFLGAKDNTYDWEHDRWYETPISEYSDLKHVFTAVPDVKYDIEKHEHSIKVTLCNNSSKPAALTILKLKDARGNLVVPAFWSDNFVSLMPFETREITVESKYNTDKLNIEVISR